MRAGRRCCRRRADAFGPPTGQENFELGDLTVPNGAFWVDDEGINVDEKDDGVVVKSSKKRRSKKKAGDSEDDA